MLKLEQIAEFASHRGITWTSRLTGLASGVIVGSALLGATKTVGVESATILFASAVVGTAIGYLLWWASCRIPRNKPNTIGVALAIRTETHEERKRVRADFIQEIASCLSRNEASQAFNVYEIPGYLAPDINDNQSAIEFLQESHCHLLIWGSIRTRKKRNNETYSLKLEGAVTHTIVEMERSKALATEMRLAIPQKTEISLANELRGFESTSQTISLAARYIVALAAAISGDWKFSKTLLLELGSSGRNPSSGKRRKTKGVGGKTEQLEVLRRVPQHLANVCFAHCHVTLLQWHDRKSDMALLEAAEQSLEEFRAASGHKEGTQYWVTKALFEVTRRGDFAAAERLLNKCRAAAINDPVWRLSLAFVSVLKGNPWLAMDLYDAALERNVPADVLLQIEDYVQWWLTLHKGPTELYLLSAMLNANGKGDKVLALADLKMFDTLATPSSDARLVLRATRLRRELETPASGSNAPGVEPALAV